MATRTVSVGVINTRSAKIQVAINDSWIPIDHIENLKIFRKINYQEKVCAGDSSAKYYVTYGSFSGSMTIYPASGAWLDLVEYQEKNNSFPQINVRAFLPKGANLSSRNEMADVRREEGNMGYFDFELFGVIFDELPMLAMSGTDYTTTVDINFVANSSTIKNRLPDHEILNLMRAVQTAGEQ